MNGRTAADANGAGGPALVLTELPERATTDQLCNFWHPRKSWGTPDLGDVQDDARTLSRRREDLEPGAHLLRPALHVVKPATFVCQRGRVEPVAVVPDFERYIVIGPYQGYGSVLRMGMAPGIAHRFACDLQNVFGLVRREQVTCGGVHL